MFGILIVVCSFCLVFTNVFIYFFYLIYIYIYIDLLIHIYRYVLYNVSDSIYMVGEKETIKNIGKLETKTF